MVTTSYRHVDTVQTYSPLNRGRTKNKVQPKNINRILIGEVYKTYMFDEWTIKLTECLTDEVQLMEGICSDSFWTLVF